MKNPYAEYRNRYLNGRTASYDAPVDISLELSSYCNMACSYCYHSDKKNLPFKMRFMDQKTIDRILHDASKIGVNSVKLNWRGEPTMSDLFGYACDLACSLAQGMTFIDRLTNSNFKFNTDREDIFQALSLQTKVKVSYDSFNARVFENQRKLGNHRLITRNIDKFYRKYQTDRTELVIQAVRTQANKDEDLEYELSKRWPNATLSVRDMVGGRVDRNLENLEVKKRDVSERQSCIQAHVRLIFDWQGNAYPCCPDIKNQLLLGNIYDQTISEIWNGAPAKNIRSELLNGKAFNYDPCKNCSSHETYKGYEPQWQS